MLSYFVSEKLNREHMEDNYYIDKNKNFYCVTDGHGGNFVSRFVCNHFFTELEKKNNEHKKKFKPRS